MSQKPNEDILNKIKIIADKFNKWKTNVPEDAIFCEELPGISVILSECLPELKDPSLFTIDHIMYPGQVIPDNKDQDYSEKLFSEIDLHIYTFAYYRLVKLGDGFTNIHCDNAFLKVVQHSPDINIFVNEMLEFLLDGKIVKDVCRGLKLLKVALATKHSKEYKDSDLCTLVSRLQKFPSKFRKDENKEKIAVFIADLATECYEMFEEEYKFLKCFDPDSKLSDKVLIFESIRATLYRQRISNKHLDILYELLTSENDEKKRNKYCKYVLRAIASYPREDFNSGFLLLINSLLYKSVVIKSDTVDKEMRIIDKHIGTNSNQLSDEGKDALETYASEKFFFYDEVMKCLHLLTIFYDAYNMRHSLCKGEFQEDISHGFEEDNKLKHFLGFYLNNPELLVPWHIEKTLQMCPFLILPHLKTSGNDPLIIDLIEFLKCETFTVKEEVNRKIEKMKAIESKTTVVWEKFKSSFPLKDDYPKREMLECVRSISKDISNTHLDFFHKLFASGNDEAKRKRYYKYFLKAVYSALDQDFNSRFLVLINSLLSKIVSIESDTVDKEMRAIDRRFDHNIEPCLDNGVVDINLNLNDLSSKEETDEDETDYSFEKSYFYDKIMKSLHLLTVFYDAYDMRHSLCEGEFAGEKNRNLSHGFEKNNKLMHLLGFYLNNPELLVPWYIEKTLQMCPFLIFPRDKWPLIIDLIKVLRDENFTVKEEVSQKIEEMKAINSTAFEWQAMKSISSLKDGSVISTQMLYE